MFHDVAGNGARDADYVRLPTSTVRIDRDNDGTRDAEDPVPQDLGEGNFAFYDLPAGRHTIRGAPGAGWVITSPAAAVDAGGAFTFDLAAGQVIANLGLGFAGTHRFKPIRARRAAARSTSRR